MNPKFKMWFEQGRALEVLAGRGEYFVPDITYREQHDFVLAVGSLVEWGERGHSIEAARALEGAVSLLLDEKQIGSALRILRCYALVRGEGQYALPLDRELLAVVVSDAVRRDGLEFARNGELRSLLLLVARDFEEIAQAVGLHA